MTWLVTGGAGYIGAHVVRAFQDAARRTGDATLEPVVLDDLSSGHRDFVPDDVAFVRASVVDTDAVRAALVEHGVTGVVHLAGFKYAGVSVQRPLHTYEQNVTGTAHLLEAMADAGVGQIVFSSSAAVYGTPDVDVVTEETPTSPESPYGESKLVGEWLLRDQGVATGLRHTSLRYFNVVGSGAPDLYDSSPHNLFPLVLDALTAGRTPRINGTDYPTPDGTCVRDYVHVADLAVSHVAAARALADGRPLAPVYNLGSGDGLSVAQIMTTVAQVTGIDFTPEVAPRRPGDPARIVASGRAAARDLDWVMRHTPEQMVASAWEAHRRPTP
ncbi:UDP-glucose 4-epimerase GalE [Cellulomonas wangsupingiae]|uniref:UDP-glucose 4-epimerase n=1 Tax=Cellulomonas wangsupingiae TaxID=2968085 RepID=A0ABY5K7Q6_9CELL|nr:UDP-glucose 4-epimerase GalE [Cellulomonas wangsupingiae]MCC2335391.1 UDP-glucose 4-epimerase GalE [Cellulomonas wangsupingiae]MCM0640077.1 UDP-glucose 4-epimerase GalE [Cellulomonas wangsupingiae]UUI64433.1 UDP-glucose 4-epimerase GalE [Cellulomonas wangsupingiae]